MAAMITRLNRQVLAAGACNYAKLQRLPDPQLHQTVDERTINGNESKPLTGRPVPQTDCAAKQARHSGNSVDFIMRNIEVVVGVHALRNGARVRRQGAAVMDW